MAAVPITIIGIATSEQGEAKNVTIVGLAHLTGLSIGGGPILPDEKPPRPPLGIWPGPGDPDYPTGLPRPEPPIVIPKPPVDPPPDLPPLPDPPPDDMVKPPPPDGGWGYNPKYGWGYFPGPTHAGPKRKL